MNNIETVLGKYFKEEKIIKKVNAHLLKEKQSQFGIPISLFFAIKPITYPKVEIIKTNNYYFLDLRYKPKIWERLLVFLQVILFIFIFRRAFQNIPVEILLIGGGLFFLAAFIYGYFYVDKGYGIKVYKKEWISKDESNGELKLEVNIPKYSKDSVLDYVFKSKIIDFLGITKNSPALSINYKFKLVD